MPAGMRLRPGGECAARRGLLLFILRQDVRASLPHEPPEGGLSAAVRLPQRAPSLVHSRVMPMKSLRCALGWGLLLCAGLAAAAPAAPRVYGLPAYQSPVRGEPDDLLLLPGYGFAADDTVVYAALADTGAPLTPPAAVPVRSDARAGVAPVVSSADAPHALTVRLPAALRSGQSYALWVRNAQGQWSNGVRINDARPLWLTPAYAYATAAVAGLPRELRVVGRNLQPAPGHATLLRLSAPGQAVIRLTAEVRDPAVAAYIAAAPLPASLAPGLYRVSLSRDGVSWTGLPDRLEVRPDPPAQRVFDVASYGCAADDGRDDTACVLQAIRAAGSAGGGIVRFGAGTWDLAGGDGGAVDGNDGMVVPRGVGLAGAGGRASRILRHADWNRAPAQPVFTLLGGNSVRDLVFADAWLHQYADALDPTLLLGKAYYRADAGAPRQVEDVVISGNVFDKVHTAIEAGGLPIARLLITRNVFGAYANDLLIAGNMFDMDEQFRVDDSVVALNLFEPGSYLDPVRVTGAIASQIGASRHLDFSRNIADGSAADYLNTPDDPRGWRAGFFWHLQGNHELGIVAQNLESCTGDKIGDGEALALDNNANTFGFDGTRAVLRAGPDSVTVEGALRPRQNERDVPLDRYYLGHWIQVGQGRGLGQVRKISAYRSDPAGGEVTFTVAPGWDVPPAPGDRVAAGREFWQFHLVGNAVDHRQPLCRKSNRSARKGGGIVVWAQTADSAVENNRQYDSDGIVYLQSYSVADPHEPTIGSWTFFQSFLELRGNLVDGEYDWDADCSSSGIQGADSASPTPSSPPPLTGYGVSISHNTIRHADGVHGGAISLARTWYDGPAPHAWQMVSGTLVHHNLIQDIGGPEPARKCAGDAAGRRVGLSLDHPMVWHSSLYANTCRKVGRPLLDLGSGTNRICPPGARSCECPGAPGDEPLQAAPH